MRSIDDQPAAPPPAPPHRRWRALPLMGRATPSHLALTALLYLFFAVFLIWPILWVVRTGFVDPDGALTLAYVRLIFQDPLLVQGLINAALVAVLVTVLCLIIALPLAVLSVKYEFPGRGLLAGLLLVPLVLPPFVGALGMRQFFSRFGPLTMMVHWLEYGLAWLIGYLNWVIGFIGVQLPVPHGWVSETGIDWLSHAPLVGIVVVEALHLYPIMLLNLQAALANIDPAMEQSAANLGAGRWTVFRRITLPLMRPGLFAGCTLVLIWSFTELGTPLMFDYSVITPVQVFRQITDVADNPLPYALVVVMLVASVLLYVVGKVLLGRSFDASTTKAGSAATTRRVTGLKGLAVAAPFVIVFALAVLPHLMVVLTSISAPGAWYKTILPVELTLGHYGQALVDDLAMPSIRNSLYLASFATLLAVAVGLGVAIIVVRSNVPGRGIIDSLAMLPLAVPGLVLAFGYLSIGIWFRQKFPGATEPDGWLFFMNVLEWPVLFLIVAYAARRMPYVVRSLVAGLQQTPRDLELAGANLGASRWMVLRRIVVPLIFANIIAGALLAFAFAMLEVADSLILAQRIDYYPITKAIFELSQRLGDGPYLAAALGVWAMVLLTLTILSASTLLGRRMGAIFRV